MPATSHLDDPDTPRSGAVAAPSGRMNIVEIAMTSPAHNNREAAPRPTLHRPLSSGTSTPRWRINGYGASITVWTVEEWERLAERPIDAQYHPCGIWLALRMD